MVNLYKQLKSFEEGKGVEEVVGQSVQKGKYQRLFEDAYSAATDLRRLHDELRGGRRIQFYRGLEHYFGKDKTGRFEDIIKELDFGEITSSYGTVSDFGIVLSREFAIRQSENLHVFSLIAGFLAVGGSIGAAVASGSLILSSGRLDSFLAIATAAPGFGMAASSGFCVPGILLDEYSKNPHLKVADKLEERAKYVSETLKRLK